MEKDPEMRSLDEAEGKKKKKVPLDPQQTRTTEELL